MSSLELKSDYRRRTILLAYDPSRATKSRQLVEWAISNVIRPNLDHVYLFSVLHAQQVFYPIIDVWTFGLVGYSNTYHSSESHHDYQDYIKREQESTRSILQSISYELSGKNVTSNIIISRGNVREELLKICSSIKPNIVLIGSSPPPPLTLKSKLRSLLNRSTFDYVKTNLQQVENIHVQSNNNNDTFKSKSKICEPKLSKKKICHAFQDVMKQIKPKSCDTSVEPIPNKNYHKLY